MNRKVKRQNKLGMTKSATNQEEFREFLAQINRVILARRCDRIVREAATRAAEEVDVKLREAVAEFCCTGKK